MALLVAHTILLEISCTDSFIYRLLCNRFETVFHGLIFWRVLFIPPIAANKNTRQIEEFYSKNSLYL